MPLQTYPDEYKFTISDTDPARNKPPSVMKWIFIDRGYYKDKPDLRGVNRALATVADPDAVRNIYVDPYSRLKALPDIDLFPNVQDLCVGSTKTKDYSKLTRMRMLRRVSLWNFKHESLRGVDLSSLDYVRVVRGKLRQIDIPIDAVQVQSCREFVAFMSVRCRKLYIEGCKNLDLDSLRHVKGAEVLDLIAPKVLPTLDFINGMPDLKSLTITANNLKQTDVSALATTTVPYIFLGVANATIHKLGPLNKGSSMITDGCVLYQYGVQQPSTAPYWEGKHQLPGA